jgi:hypothetical protein
MKILSPTKELLKSRRGSAMVEGAIYFPIIILSAVFAIIMMINMYSGAAATARLHMQLRAQAGEQTGLTISHVSESAIKDRYGLAPMKTDDFFGMNFIGAEGKKTYKGGPLTGEKTITERYKARVYLINDGRDAKLKSAALSAIK